MEGFEAQLPMDCLPGSFAILQSNRLLIHKTLDYIAKGLQGVLEDAEDSSEQPCIASIICFCQ